MTLLPDITGYAHFYKAGFYATVTESKQGGLRGKIKLCIKSIYHSLALAILISFLMISPAWAAQDEIWTSVVDNIWTTSGNWSDGSAPDGKIKASLIFDNSDAGDRTITAVDGAYTKIKGINFNGVAGGFSMSGTGSFSMKSGKLITGNGALTHNFNNIGFIGNGKGFTFGGTDSYIVGGVISGTSITQSSSGTLTLTGNNTYSDGTTLIAGTIILGHDNALGTGTLTLDGDCTLQSNNDARSVNNLIDTGGNALTVSGTSNLILSGVISGAGGTLTKNGSGTLTLSGNNTYNGLTTLNAGGLILSGQVGGALTVNGGTLSGTGTIGGTLTLAGGIFSPGSSIGTTTITGDYVQNAGSTLEIEVENASGTLNSDLLDVTGSATLASGNTISVTDISAAGNIIETGDTFTIIEADGGVTDNGATITDNSAVLSFAGLINGNNYQLVATRETFANSVSLGTNTPVLKAIDSDLGSAAGDYATLINTLTALDSVQCNDAAQKLNPLPHASPTSVSLKTTQQMAGNLANYLTARRSGVEKLMILNAKSRESRLLVADVSSDPRMLAYIINENKKIAKMQQDEADGEVSVFFRPFGVFYNHDSTSQMAGFDAKAVGAQFGFDKGHGPNLIIGIGGGYSHSFINFKEGLGEGDTDSFRAGPYATYFKDNFFIDTSVSFGYHKNKNKRNIRFGTINRTAKSDYHAYNLSAYIGGGYNLPVNDWTVTPTASLQYTRYRSESFEETGAGAAGLDVDAATAQSLRGKLGLTLSTVAELYGTKFVPELFAGWAHEFMDDEDINARFVEGTTKFTTDVDDGRDDSVYFGAGVSVLLRENISAFVRYEGNYSSGNGINALNVGITVLF